MPSVDEMLLFERDGQVATLTLNRPQVRNAVSLAMLERFDTLLDELYRNRPRAVIIGAVEPGYCAGIDLKEARDATVELVHARVTVMHRVMRKLRHLPVPVITAVNGVAVGFGCELTISGDLRLASPEARFSYSEVRVAVPSPGHQLIWLVGLARAQDLMLTGRWFDASEAERIGFVTRVCPDPNVAARELAEELCLLAPKAVADTKENFRMSVNAGLDAAVQHHIDSVTSATWTGDRREALAAFAERREPRFTGS
jgi:enoyl-CoA hydratase/carnithine racemase